MHLQSNKNKYDLMEDLLDYADREELRHMVKDAYEGKEEIFLTKYNPSWREELQAMNTKKYAGETIENTVSILTPKSQDALLHVLEGYAGNSDWNLVNVDSIMELPHAIRINLSGSYIVLRRVNQHLSTKSTKLKGFSTKLIKLGDEGSLTVDLLITPELVQAFRQLEATKKGASRKRYAQVEEDEDLENDDELLDDVVDDGPSPEDIMIDSSGNGYSVRVVEGKSLGKFTSIVQAERAIKKYMEKNDFYPSIWIVNDHGNVSPYSLDAEEAEGEIKSIIVDVDFEFGSEGKMVWIYAEAEALDAANEKQEYLSKGSGYKSDEKSIRAGCLEELADLKEELKKNSVDVSDYEVWSKEAVEEAMDNL